MKDERDDYGSSPGEGSESLINSAFLDAKRRSLLQSSINYHLVNPLLYDEEMKSYFFEIAFSSMNNLLVEISPKLSKEELKEMTDKRKKIQNFLDTKEIFLKRYDDFNRVSAKILNKENWNFLREELFEFSLSLKRLGDTHGFGSPDKLDPRASIINN
jgi:hypothetical protein